MDRSKPHRLPDALIVPRSVLILLCLFALLSTLQGAHTALTPTRSQDFQWSGERLLLQHVDPWAEYLRGDPDHRLILTQVPNYLPLLYVALVPLGALSLVHAKLLWVACNLIFALAGALLTARFYGFGSQATILLTSLFLIATPTRNSFGNGQQSLLVLLLWCLSLLTPNLIAARSAIAGASYFKFNFAPPVALYLLMRGGLRAVLFSVLPAAAATALVWLWLPAGHDLHGLARFIIEPLAVSQRGFFPSGMNPNFMDVLQATLLLVHLPMHVIDPVILLAAVLLCAAILYLAVVRHPQTSLQGQMALLATMSFCLFRHHDYDSVVLLFPFAYAISRWRDPGAKAVLALGAYLWYFRRLVDGIHFFPGLYLLDWTLLMIILYLTFHLSQREAVVEAPVEMRRAA